MTDRVAESLDNETLAMVEMSNCLDGVLKALENKDIESVVYNVQTFSKIDAEYKDSSSDLRGRLLATQEPFELMIKELLKAAEDHGDHATVLRIIRLSSSGEEEVLEVYTSYIKKVMPVRSKHEFEQLVEQNQWQVDIVAWFTNLLEDMVSAIEDNEETLRSLYGEGGIVYAMCELQKECDSRGSLVLRKYMELHKLSRPEINAWLSGREEGPDPIEIESYLNEISSLSQLVEDHAEKMVSKIEGLNQVNPELTLVASKAFRSGNFRQDLTSYYVRLEKYFMVENVRKAINIDGLETNSHISTMVGDVFYVLWISCHRSISTSDIKSVIAALTRAISLLDNEYTNALLEKFVALFPVYGLGVQNRGINALTILNNMDVSVDHAQKLRDMIKLACAEVFHAPADRLRIRSGLSELGDISYCIKQALDVGLGRIVDRVTDSARAVFNGVEAASYEAEYDPLANHPWVHRLIDAVVPYMERLDSLMTANTYDSFVRLLIDFIVKRLAEIMMEKRFSYLGGLQLDRDVTALVNQFSRITQTTVTHQFACLTQMATILKLEDVSEILDFFMGETEISGPMTSRLTRSEVRRVLRMRVDFNPEAIDALVL